MMRRRWTPDEYEVVRAFYPCTRTDKIAALLGRSVEQVYNSAGRLGLSKTERYLASPAACRLRRDEHPGKATQFKPGQIPVNKGVKMPPGWGPGRMKETQFKPGERTGFAAKNWRPIGTILPDTEGFLRIKVCEGKKGAAYGFGNTKIWPLLNRYTWEQHHGPIPKGHVVIFKDRDRNNCDILNLEMITLADNMRRNTIHRLPKDLANLIMLTGALTRQIRKHERNGNGKKHDAGSTQPSL